MLTITNIDNCNFSLQGLLATITGLKVYGKREFAAKSCEPVYNETYGRIVVYNINTDDAIIDKTPINQITLDGTIHTTAQAFVVAFNNMIAECGAVAEATTTAEVTTTAEPTTTATPTTTSEPTTTGA